VTDPGGTATAGRRPRSPRLLRRLPIVLRLVLAVAAAMLLVLGGDLTAYQQSLVRALRDDQPPHGAAGSLYQVLDTHGRIVKAGHKAGTKPLITNADVEAATKGAIIHRDIGGLLPITPNTLRLTAERVRLPGRTVIAVGALPRGHRDEALRELLAQLGIAAGLTLLAASYVGYRTARGALDPVERFRRRAATLADGASGVRLPVPEDRDDELTRLGHTLNRMLDRLEAAAAREHRFVADASHELRTPLSLLRAELDVALHRPRTHAELTDILSSVDGEVQRLIDLSNALLNLEELSSTEHITRAPVDLPDLVDAAVSPYLRAAESGHRRMTVEVAPAIVEVDARWIRPALGNLIDNALRHGRGDIHVSAAVADRRLRLAVTDEGPGFPADFLPQAFDRFTRAEASRTSPGSGLGLALVAVVAASHGGTAHAENTPNGSAVDLDIPC
jgi:two-component system, OmpR family, sensor kinase